MKSTQLLVLVIALLVTGCLKKNEKQISKGFIEASSGTVKLTDTIIYDVIIRAIDTEDQWEGKRLQGFDQKSFVNFIFDNIYNGKFEAYDYFSNKKLSNGDVRNLEKAEGFNRAKVSKIQFNESWGFSPKGEFIKKINYIILGVESYSNQGTFIGHNALFKVYTSSIAQ